MAYTVEFRPSVWKNVKNVPKKDLVKIKSKIEEISFDLPDPSTTKMSGNTDFHKVRCSNYRIIHEILEDRLWWLRFLRFCNTSAWRFRL